jgi:hypothetical protein
LGCKNPSDDVGLRAILVKSLSVENRTRAMTETENDTVRKHAQALSEQIRTEDGIGESVEWIEKYSNNFHMQG